MNILLNNPTQLARYVTLAVYYQQKPTDCWRMLESIREISFGIIGSLEIIKEHHYGNPPIESCTGNLRDAISRCELPQPVWFSIDCANPVSREQKLDFLWSVHYDSAGIASGTPQSTFLNVTFGASFLNESQRTRLDMNIDTLLKTCVLNGKAFCGLVDVGDRYDTGFGRHYSTSGQGWLRFSRKIEKHLWSKAGTKQIEKVRGVFWGNLLGPAMVERLGGPEGLVDGFARSIGDYEPHFLQQDELTAVLPDGSVFLKVSPKVSSMYQPSGIGITDDMVQRAAWLYQRLAEARLLIGM